MIISLLLTTLATFSRAEGPHDFFNELAARHDVLKASSTVKGIVHGGVPRAYSLRPDPASGDIRHARWKNMLNPEYRPAAEAGYLSPRGAHNERFAGYHHGCWNGGVCTDAHPQRQDAMKVLYPPFSEIPVAQLAQDLLPGATVVHIDKGGPGQNGRSLKLCDEIVVSNRSHTMSETAISVDRAQYGSAEGSCPAGSPVYSGGSDSPVRVRLQLDTKPGNHTYLIFVDHYFTSSFMGLTFNHKSYYMYDAGGGLWLLPEYGYNGGGAVYNKAAGFDKARHVAVPGWRHDAKQCEGAACHDYSLLSYSTGGWVGGGFKAGSYPTPIAGALAFKPNTWIRLIIKLEQRSGDYDYVTTWVGDEHTTPVKMLDRMPITLADGVKAGKDLGSPDGLSDVLLGWDTSSNANARGPNCDLSKYVIGDYEDLNCNLALYVRNFIVLEDPPDVDTLVLRKPVGHGAPPAETPPARPRGLMLLP